MFETFFLLHAAGAFLEAVFLQALVFVFETERLSQASGYALKFPSCPDGVFRLVCFLIFAFEALFVLFILVFQPLSQILFVI